MKRMMQETDLVEPMPFFLWNLCHFGTPTVTSPELCYVPYRAFAMPFIAIWNQ
jgi:hypothetical protein